MASEIRVNKIENRSGLGTVTFADTGVDLAGISTAATLKVTTGIVTTLTVGTIKGAVTPISDNGTIVGIADTIDLDLVLMFLLYLLVSLRLRLHLSLQKNLVRLQNQ